MPNCPACNSECIQRSKRRGIFERRVLPLVLLRPFRCKRCDHRFFSAPLEEDLVTTPPAETSASSVGSLDRESI